MLWGKWDHVGLRFQRDAPEQKKKAVLPLPPGTCSGCRQAVETLSRMGVKESGQAQEADQLENLTNQSQ